MTRLQRKYFANVVSESSPSPIISIQSIQLQFFMLRYARGVMLRVKIVTAFI